MTHLQIADKLQDLRPLAAWILVGNSYDGITWLDQVQTKPTAEEIGL